MNSTQSIIGIWYQKPKKIVLIRPDSFRVVAKSLIVFHMHGSKAMLLVSQNVVLA